jgi:hypothetical protein
MILLRSLFVSQLLAGSFSADIFGSASGSIRGIESKRRTPDSASLSPAPQQAESVTHRTVVPLSKKAEPENTENLKSHTDGNANNDNSKSSSDSNTDSSKTTDVETAEQLRRRFRDTIILKADSLLPNLWRSILGIVRTADPALATQTIRKLSAKIEKNGGFARQSDVVELLGKSGEAVKVSGSSDSKETDSKKADSKKSDSNAGSGGFFWSGPLDLLMKPQNIKKESHSDSDSNSSEAPHQVESALPSSLSHEVHVLMVRGPEEKLMRIPVVADVI